MKPQAASSAKEVLAGLVERHLRQCGEWLLRSAGERAGHPRLPSEMRLSM